MYTESAIDTIVGSERYVKGNRNYSCHGKIITHPKRRRNRKNKNADYKKTNSKNQNSVLEKKVLCCEEFSLSSSTDSSSSSSSQSSGPLSSNCEGLEVSILSNSSDKNDKVDGNSRSRRRGRRVRSRKYYKETNEEASVPCHIRASIIALDCEMVGVGPSGFRSAVARVTLVDYNNSTLLDTFVRVAEEVTDYRTFVSGVHESDLKSEEALSLDECRQKVERLLRGKILVGHGLKCDLQSLGLVHPWHDIRDTAKYEPYMKVVEHMCSKRGQVARKLKELVAEKIGREIQKPGQSHSPYEDAVAALDLYKLDSRKWEMVMQYKMRRTMEIQGVLDTEKHAAFNENASHFSQRMVAVGAC
mmetsp:Transcript_57834/g.69577  ORF Transcript_57834/g.69577 Transcript_57834/m.69577 type:complete len:359 (+) Transcript_57834:73-1149(+)|eukprot:CAMPEP_0194354548 /NCGR_PEP_ID=MMETSP0174-20130528/2682_1 /TAXON_ID=216777 /ORGANISM="Proboscia alata, Strain PI-D3" /LENGTH=358 /DNA_ID=CAMNT_0039123535 /DNA_START=55 /DNA_END=1131 /DNA_ORIENTATION=+